MLFLAAADTVDTFLGRGLRQLMLFLPVADTVDTILPVAQAVDTISVIMTVTKELCDRKVIHGRIYVTKKGENDKLVFRAVCV